MRGYCMLSACVLINCEPGQYHEVAKKIKKIKGISRVFAATGRWDVIAEIEVPYNTGIAGVALKVNGVPGVSETETLIEAIF